MPPPVEEYSEGESTGGSIPFGKTDGKKDAPAEEVNGDESEEDVSENEFIVEKIVGHEFRKNKLFLVVKWKDWDNPEDLTVEPEENILENAKEIVDEYYKSQGGRPEKGPGRKRKSTGGAKQIAEKAEPKRRKKSQPAEATPEGDDVADWVPKGKSWENDVELVDTIIRDQESNSLVAYLHWKNGKKSRVSLDTCYEKCPMKMLKFYEQHLVFKET
ncbi:heterochromatin protein [Aspergillus sclerotialis]|uniref:Heterochromatin protein n=1 Tax=Aspergillus sclerotialis TaxID=2070753 RepID=A0A3A2Z593_9EURO|nr:heterochromatin protein [Aspergillus sclerotialis]